MGIVAIIFGILSVVALIFKYYLFLLLPAVVGLIFGIVDVFGKAQKNLPKKQGIAGIALNALVIFIILIVFKTTVTANANQADVSAGLQRSNIADVEKAKAQLTLPSGCAPGAIGADDNMILTNGVGRFVLLSILKINDFDDLTVHEKTINIIDTKTTVHEKKITIGDMKTKAHYD